MAIFSLHCYRLRNIHSRNVNNLNVDLYNVPRSNVNMEGQLATFCVGNINVCPICYRLRRWSRINSPMYSNWIFDLENKGQWRWQFRWKLVREFDVATCIQNWRASTSSRLCAINNRTFLEGRTHSRTQSARISPFNSIESVYKSILQGGDDSQSTL